MSIGQKILLLIMLLCVAYLGFGGAFAKQENVLQVLENRGYTKVSITDHQWFFVYFHGCPGRVAKFKVTAIDPTMGKETKFFACIGWPRKSVVTGID